MTHLHFGVNFGIDRERCLSIEWVWSIRANVGLYPVSPNKLTAIEFLRVQVHVPVYSKITFL